MIGYKATRNFKCRDQLYRVGKTYTSDRLEICKHGFHYCKNMETTLNFYTPNKDFILLEIEILGEVIEDGCKSVTNKMKVLRVVPFEEYTGVMKKKFPTFEYDERSNIISEADDNDYKRTYEYDANDNLIASYLDGKLYWTYEYDERRNMISSKWVPGNRLLTFEYDEKNNNISTTTPDDKWTHSYDEHNRLYLAKRSDGAEFHYDPTLIIEQ
jgi:YD repeat-containing protein